MHLLGLSQAEGAVTDTLWEEVGVYVVLLCMAVAPAVMLVLP